MVKILLPIKKIIFGLRIKISNEIFKLAFAALPNCDYKSGLAQTFNDFNLQVQIENGKK